MPDTCWNCGRPVSPEQPVCECGAETGGGWRASRETTLLLTFLVLVGAFAVTALAARFYHDRRRDLAEFWFGQGLADLNSGKASTALSDLQTALIYGQDVSGAQQQAISLNLGQALVASHRLDEAHAYLLDLWQSTPDSARLNLELAHLSAAMGNDADAQRYYGNAIYGIWQGSPEQVRQYQRNTQLELSRYLLDRNETTAAQSVLLAVAASLPRDPALHIKVGNLMREASAAAQALEQYQDALEIDRRDHDAQVGAGLSSFALGNDREAVRYLGQTSALKPQTGQSPGLPPDAARDLAVASADLTLDFLEPGVDAEVRAQRAVRAYEVAKTRLQACAKSLGVSLPVPVRSTATASVAGTSNGNPAPDDMATSSDQARKLQGSARETELERNPQLIDPLGKFVFAAESAATAHCGPPTAAEDAALLRLEQRYTGQNHE